MIRKTIIVLFAVAAAASVGLGVYSFHRGIPDETIWISSLTRGQHVQTALVRGGRPRGVHGAVRQARRGRGGEAARGLLFQEDDGWNGRPHSTGHGRGRAGLGRRRGCWRRIRRWPSIAARCSGGGAAGRGACTCCGYNLTGNTSGICPECGSSAAAQGEPLWDAVLWVLAAFHPRRVAFVLCTLAAVGTAAAWGLTCVRSLEYGSSARGLTVLVNAGTAVLRYEPTNYQMLKCRTVRADVATDWRVVRMDRAYERAVDGSVTAPTPYQTNVEVDLWLPTLLLASYPVGVLIGIWRRRRQILQADSPLPG